MPEILLKHTPIGKRAYPINTADADALVKQGKAIKVRNRIYEEVIKESAAQVEPKKVTPAKKAPAKKKASTKSKKS